MRRALIPLILLMVLGSSLAAASPARPFDRPMRHPVWWPPGATAPEPLPFTPGRAAPGPVEAARALPADAPVAPRAAWTVLVYMDGDNDLERYVVRDIEDELGAVGSTADVHVLALADRAPGGARNGGDWTGTRLFYVTEGQRAVDDEALADLGERNLGDPETLTEALTWTRAHYPSDKVALVLWDHGWGWRPDNTLIDETDGDSLDVDELSRALSAAGGVDVIGFDACMMASLEVQAQLRGAARALAASEDYVGWDGFDYAQVLSTLTVHPELGAQDVAVLLAQSMSKGDSYTASAVALDARWDRLLASVDTLAAALLDDLGDEAEAIDAARKASQRFSGDMSQHDLYDLARALSTGVDDGAVRRAAGAVMDALDEVTLYEWHVRPYDGGAYGTSIYWPVDEHDRYSWYTLGERPFPFYQGRLNLSSATAWDEMLSASFRAR